MDYTEKMRRILEYVEALEEEKRKIQVFQRELPLCLELVTQGIHLYFKFIFLCFFIFFVFVCVFRF